MIVKTDTKSLKSMMDNILGYSYGFLDGVESGKQVFLKNLGDGVIQALYQYIDTNARINPSALHHVYEWYQVGSPSARLYNLNYTVSNLGLSIKSDFKQSRTISQDGTVPFYNKAKIMEDGTPVNIVPKKGALVFDVGGETVFTKKEVVVRNPGGQDVQGSFEKTFDEFMMSYFKQSFIRASGLYDYLNKPTLYKTEFRSGTKVGKNKGISTGYKWIVNARIGVE